MQFDHASSLFIQREFEHEVDEDWEK